MKKWISTGPLWTSGVKCDLVTEVRLVTLNPTRGKDFFEHVEAHQSAYDPGTAGRSGTGAASSNVYTDSARGGRAGASTASGYRNYRGPGDDRQVAGD